MSRIGKLPITLDAKTTATINGDTIIVKGALGELTFTKSSLVNVVIEDKTIVVSIDNLEDSTKKALWGTTRAVLNNMVEWVSKGYKKSLEIVWVWYKFEVSGAKITLSIGFSHKVEMDVPKGLTAAMDEKLKNTIHLTGIDKQLLGEFTAKIRAKKKPEPYKGKWIKYVWERIRRKAGKTGK